MKFGEERIERIRAVLQGSELDGLICTLPANVLLLSGYWPVVGSALAVATSEGRVTVLAPEDERELAEHGWAAVRTYRSGSLEQLASPVEAIRDPLAALLRDLGVDRGRLAIETGDAYEPVSYVAMYLYGAAGAAVLGEAAPRATISAAADPLARLRGTMTVEEVGQVRLACEIAAGAFAAGMRAIRLGADESTIAAAYQTPLSVQGLDCDGVERAGGFVYCMSGANSALAGGAYARTRARTIEAGDLVLVHCNSCVNGYWTDITRTYCLGQPDERQRAMYRAVFEARAAALAAIRPGVRAASVDRAAREVLAAHGFGAYFTHGIGHNVGFSAISAEYPPRLHPASDDTLEVGMTFNVEPAIYIRGYGGIRHCDVVTLGLQGPDVLTPFQITPESLVICI